MSTPNEADKAFIADSNSPNPAYFKGRTKDEEADKWGDFNPERYCRRMLWQHGNKTERCKHAIIYLADELAEAERKLLQLRLICRALSDKFVQNLKDFDEEFDDFIKSSETDSSPKSNSETPDDLGRSRKIEPGWKPETEPQKP